MGTGTLTPTAPIAPCESHRKASRSSWKRTDNSRGPSSFCPATSTPGS